MYFRNRVLRSLDASNHLSKPKGTLKTWGAFKEVVEYLEKTPPQRAKLRSAEEFLDFEIKLATSPLLFGISGQLFKAEYREFLRALKERSHGGLFATQENFIGKRVYTGEQAVVNCNENLMETPSKDRKAKKAKEKEKINDAYIEALIKFCLEFHVTDLKTLLNIENSLKGLAQTASLSRNSLLLCMQILNRIIACYPSEVAVSRLLDVIKCLKRDFEANENIIINTVLIDCLSISEALEHIPNSILLAREVSTLITEYLRVCCSPTSLRFKPRELVRLSKLILQEAGRKAKPEESRSALNELRTLVLEMLETFWVCLLDSEDDGEEFDEGLYAASTRMLIEGQRGRTLLRLAAESKLNGRKVARIIRFLGIYKQCASANELYDPENFRFFEKLQKESKEFNTASWEKDLTRNLLYIFVDMSVDKWDE